MRSKTAAAILAGIVAISCARAGEAGQGKLSGTDSSAMRVLIRKIDSGDILWVGRYQLGTEAEIASGAHTVSVMCEFHEPYEMELVPGTLSITVEAGKTYAVTGTRSGKSCDVSASPK